MTTFHSGREGKVATAGVDLPVTGWQGTFRTELVDVTNAASGGFAEYLPGILSGRVLFTLPWDSDQLPNAAPGLTEGNSVACQLHCAGTGKTFGGTVLVESVQYESVVRGPPVRLTVTGVFSGSYTRPSA